jgi:serine/threonine-protein kinase HipA
VSGGAVEVCADLRGTPVLVGRLWTRTRGGRESATFQYDAQWLAHPERFALEPALSLDAAAFHTAQDRALFGALGDSAPDRWGRMLLARAERHRARREGRAPRALREVDYLMGVADATRLGALRFRTTEGGPFLAEPGEGAAAIPPLVDLRRLLSAASRVESDDASDEDLRLLVAPGSSLGGARPKASVRDRDGSLAIAKFPSNADDYDVVRWEGVALALARRAGIQVPAWRLAAVAGRAVLVLARFDRRGSERIPFISALSLLGAADGDTRSYPEMAEALRRYGAATATDLHQLWRRLLFSVLVSNTDDHLRNHGFLCEGPEGWRLSPAYDMNPTPPDVKPRVLATAITLDGDATASFDLTLSVIAHFALDLGRARRIAGEVAAAVAGWRAEAKRQGLSKKAQERMAPAFEHADLAAARARRQGARPPTPIADFYGRTVT